MWIGAKWKEEKSFSVQASFIAIEAWKWLFYDTKML